MLEHKHKRKYSFIWIYIYMDTNIRNKGLIRIKMCRKHANWNIMIIQLNQKEMMFQSRGQWLLPVLIPNFCWIHVVSDW